MLQDTSGVPEESVGLEAPPEYRRQGLAQCSRANALARFFGAGALASGVGPGRASGLSDKSSARSAKDPRNHPQRQHRSRSAGLPLSSAYQTPSLERLVLKRSLEEPPLQTSGRATGHTQRTHPAQGSPPPARERGPRMGAHCAQTRERALATDRSVLIWLQNTRTAERCRAPDLTSSRCNVALAHADNTCDIPAQSSWFPRKKSAGRGPPQQAIKRGSLAPTPSPACAGAHNTT